MPSPHRPPRRSLGACAALRSRDLRHSRCSLRSLSSLPPHSPARFLLPPPNPNPPLAAAAASAADADYDTAAEGATATATNDDDNADADADAEGGERGIHSGTQGSRWRATATNYDDAAAAAASAEADAAAAAEGAKGGGTTQCYRRRQHRRRRRRRGRGRGGEGRQRRPPTAGPYRTGSPFSTPARGQELEGLQSTPLFTCSGSEEFIID